MKLSRQTLFLKSRCLMLLACVIGSTAQAEVGSWEKRGGIGLDNVSCVQTWSCAAPAHIDLGDSQIVASPPKSTRGTCDSGGAAGESCGSCSAEPPKEPCMWFLEPKQRR